MQISATPRGSSNFIKAVADARAITQEELSKRTFAKAAANRASPRQRPTWLGRGAGRPNPHRDRTPARSRPVSGQMLQVKIHLGEYAQVGPLPRR